MTALKKLIVFATIEEAQATLSKLQAAREKDFWSYPGGKIVICGWGCKNSHDACLKYGVEADEIWNIGIAGALKDDLELGRTYHIGVVGKDEERITLNVSGLKLVSSDIPVHDHLLKMHLSQNWDLVDMEGHGVALAATNLGKKCRLFKLVSDFAMQETRELIYKHMLQNSERLYESCFY